MKPSKTLKNPLVSIIVLNYNGLKYLKRTLPAILTQTYSNYELILVDNGSSDGSVEWVKKWKQIKIISIRQNKGYGWAKNRGASAAKGSYFLIMDNDILVKDRGMLKKIIKDHPADTGFIQIPLLDINNSYTKYYGIYYSIYGVTSHLKPISMSRILQFPETFVKIGAPTGGCFFVSRSTWEKIGGFDESQFFNIDDIDIGPRAVIFGKMNYLYTKNFFIHLGVENARSVTDYAARLNLLFSGHARSMIKNYSIRSLLIRFPALCVYQFGKALLYSWRKRSVKILNAYFRSVWVFVSHIGDTINQRKKIQRKRVNADSSFLSLKPPRY